MKNAKINLLLFSLSGLTVLALAGSSLGTLAWYAYSVRVTTEFSGTAVNQTEQLQIGLLWDDVTTDQRNSYAGGNGDYASLSFDTIGGHTYWFMDEGQGFTATHISTYLSAHHYTTNSLQPVTSREYATGNAIVKDNGTSEDTSDDFVGLYQAPSATYVETDTVATKEQYVYLPFAFRIISFGSGTTRSYAKKASIWMTDVTTAIANSRIADRALRIHVDNFCDPNLLSSGVPASFTLNPKATHVENKDFTYVAGLLDLKKAHYYDTDSLSRELIYGDISISDRSTLYSKTVMQNYTTFNADTTAENSNVNGVTPAEMYTGNSNEAADTETTFYSKHRAGTKGFTSFLDASGNDIRKKSEYVCMSTIKPEKDSNGDLVDGYPIAVTANDNTGLARTDMYVYLEGWDHSIVDSQIDSEFSLGLQFEINRV
ncbi:MAG: hypothetical protein K6B65_01450 [Bacilli bacterium]|nr:hypothetical protein [Bacilli bacterium]